VVPALEVRLHCARSVCFVLAVTCVRCALWQGQRMLIAYPCALVYGLFTLLTIG
jgi:hypothetical protein